MRVERMVVEKAALMAASKVAHLVETKAERKAEM